MKKIILTLVLLITISIQAQDIKRSNWQRTETQGGIEQGVSVYFFEITENTIKSTNKKGSKDYGTWIIDKVYSSGTESYFWSVIDEDIIKHTYKDTFTGKYQITTFIIK